jgi:hypothetical protein
MLAILKEEGHAVSFVLARPGAGPRKCSDQAVGDAKRRVEEFAESQLFEGDANGRSST